MRRSDRSNVAVAHASRPPPDGLAVASLRSRVVVAHASRLRSRELKMESSCRGEETRRSCLFCAVCFAMPFATLSEAQIIYRRQRRKQRPSFARTENASLSSFPSVEFSASQREFLQKTAKETKVGIGFATPLRYLRFLLFNLFGRGGSPEPPQRSSPSTANMQASTTTDQTDITDTLPSFVIRASSFRASASSVVPRFAPKARKIAAHSFRATTFASLTAPARAADCRRHLSTRA